MAEHGLADLVSFDYFDRLATQVWHLPVTPGQGFAGWAHADVEVMMYARAHVTVYFIMVRRPGSLGIGMEDYTWKFFGCADSRNGRVISARPDGCRVG